MNDAKFFLGANSFIIKKVQFCSYFTEKHSTNTTLSNVYELLTTIVD